ncbi:hypothetical protein Chor_006351, partial [Crotalus horridus]
MSPEVALNRISPSLSPLISNVVRNGKVGLDATNCLRITDLKSGCTSLTLGPSCDRFKLHIPYAGETLKWDIIFNAHYPELPPDFIFGEDAEFLPDPSSLHRCQNLACWNPSNPECLLLVVKELVQQYHQFQCSRLRESSRLMFEYQTLLEEPQYGENMEIYAGKKNNWTGEFSARFLLKLPVDFSNIPTYLLKGQIGYSAFNFLLENSPSVYEKSLARLFQFQFFASLGAFNHNPQVNYNSKGTSDDTQVKSVQAKVLFSLKQKKSGYGEIQTHDMARPDANEDPGEDVALLSVSFEDTEATQVFPKLYLSPRIE